MVSSIITLGSLVILVAAAPLDVATAIVNNQCSFGVSIWSTGTGPTYIEPNTIYSEPLVGETRTLLVEQGQHAPGDINRDIPKVSFGYTAQGDMVYYDMDTLSGGWPQSHLVLAATGNGCAAIDFPDGVNPAPGQDHTQACTSSSDVALTLCA
jgi:Bys1 family protein